MRYIPTPYHTKLWQERTPLAQYINNEVSGNRMGRWTRPIHDFIMPYIRGAGQRVTGKVVIPEEVQARRDLNTLADVIQHQVSPSLPNKDSYAGAPISTGFQLVD